MMRARHSLYLANNLWLIGHDEYTGKNQINNHTLGLGLAGCLLGELILAGKIDISARRDLIVLDRQPPPDPVGRILHSEILSETNRPTHIRVVQIRDWLIYLSEFASAQVLRRLALDGVVRAVEVRGRFGLGRNTHHIVTDVNDVAMLGVNISQRLTGDKRLTVRDIAFAGFAIITRLEHRLLIHLAGPDRAYLHRALERLPASLRSLIAETEAAIGDAVLSHRT